MKKYIATIHDTTDDSFCRSVELMANDVYSAHKRAFQHLDLSKHEEVKVIEEVSEDGTNVRVYDSNKGFI